MAFKNLSNRPVFVFVVKFSFVDRDSFVATVVDVDAARAMVVDCDLVCSLTFCLMLRSTFDFSLAVKTE